MCEREGLTVGRPSGLDVVLRRVYQSHRAAIASRLYVNLVPVWDVDTAPADYKEKQKPLGLCQPLNATTDAATHG